MDKDNFYSFDTSNISNAVFGDYESELLLTTIREWAELTQKRSEAAPLQETAAQPTTTEGTATRKSGASGTGDVRARLASPVPSDGHEEQNTQMCVLQEQADARGQAEQDACSDEAKQNTRKHRKPEEKLNSEEATLLGKRSTTSGFFGPTETPPNNVEGCCKCFRCASEECKQENAYTGTGARKPFVQIRS